VCVEEQNRKAVLAAFGILLWFRKVRYHMWYRKYHRIKGFGSVKKIKIRVWSRQKRHKSATLFFETTTMIMFYRLKENKYGNDIIKLQVAVRLF